MATTTKQPQGMLGGATGHVGHTMQATVTERPGRAEVAFDAALIAGGIMELVSPPVAIAGIALNRLVHVAK